jgi:hypothetical protein
MSYCFLAFLLLEVGAEERGEGVKRNMNLEPKNARAIAQKSEWR